MFLLFPRADSGYSSTPKSDAPHGNHGSNKTTQVIIGVVVGGVAAIAITAGIIFFLIKKRKWDRIRQCEERLIDYQLATGCSSKLQSRSVTPEDYLNMMASPPPTSTTAPYPYNVEAGAVGQGQRQEHRPVSRARGMSAPATTTLSTAAPGSSPESPPPAYQTLHPRYDPSRYSQMSTRFSSSFEISRSSTNNVTGDANRNPWGLSVSGVFSGPNHNPNVGARPESSMLLQLQRGSQYQPYQYQPGPPAFGSASESNWPSSYEATTTPAGPSESNSTPARGSDQGSGSQEQGPRRPKPVLSRLITNL
ncbi:uncharacterized protein BDV17DRAFT_291104 [Aspergillus undulatus]|uniref:uncharacterized protein n=1 Tax=Aspergillus undulatus TaxID=1810928 RepID=UPI003CCDFF66